MKKKWSFAPLTGESFLDDSPIRFYDSSIWSGFLVPRSCFLGTIHFHNLIYIFVLLFCKCIFIIVVLISSYHSLKAMLMNILANALKTITNAEKRGKRQVLVRPCSKVLLKFLQCMQKKGRRKCQSMLMYRLHQRYHRDWWPPLRKGRDWPQRSSEQVRMHLSPLRYQGQRDWDVDQQPPSLPSVRSHRPDHLHGNYGPRGGQAQAGRWKGHWFLLLSYEGDLKQTDCLFEINKGCRAKRSEQDWGRDWDEKLY